MKTAITTIEMRWFHPGKVPTEVNRWFQQYCPGAEAGIPEEREDLYLHSPTCEYLSIKLR